MAERAAWLSITVNVILTLLNMAIAAASGSLAVAAEMVHNLVDLVSAVAVLVGVKVSERKSRAFPYGLYKVENVVAIVIAVLIFVTGYEIAKQALLAGQRQATVTPLMLGGVALSAIIPLVFSIYEMRVGRAVNSPSLMADAQEYRVHVFSSGIALVALVGQMIGWPLDRAAALIIVLLIAKTGWELLQDGMRVLLDASLDAGTLDQVRTIIEAEPSVAVLKSLTGRNAGRYRFLEAEVTLRVQDLDRAHGVTERMQRKVRAEVPHVERVLIHAEPLARTHLRYALPLQDEGGTISEHFGEAPFFALLTLRTADSTIVRQEMLPNPHGDVAKAKGIRVAEWLVEQKVDVVMLRESLQGKGPEYVFGDAGVETLATTAATLAQARVALTKRV
jgi:cation diffusion facilitator family transporter